MPHKSFATALTVGATLALGASSYFALGAGPLADSEPAPVTKAVAVINAASHSKVSGTVSFTKTSGGVKVEAKIKGLTPGKHGFHIHEFGDATSPDAKSAGGHFNPKNHPHSGPGMQRHVGDLGNIEADAEGNATYDKIDSQLMFHGDSNILGRAVIVHEKADDLKTQPTGDAGGRVGIGVIGIAKP
jgi:superoxide dismutase, Cu-Zn family